MKVRRPILSVLSIIVLVGAVVLGTSASASAGTDVWVSSTDSAPTGGLAIFDADSADDEIFSVCDLDLDGHYAWGEFSWTERSVDYFDFGEDDGRCSYSTIQNVPEGRTVTVTICLVNKISGTYDYCRTRFAKA